MRLWCALVSYLQFLSCLYGIGTQEYVRVTDTNHIAEDYRLIPVILHGNFFLESDNLFFVQYCLEQHRIKKTGTCREPTCWLH